MMKPAHRRLSLASLSFGGRRFVSRLGLPAALLLSACGPEALQQDTSSAEGTARVTQEAALGEEQTVVLEPVADTYVSSASPTKPFTKDLSIFMASAGRRFR